MRFPTLTAIAAALLIASQTISSAHAQQPPPLIDPLTTSISGGVSFCGALYDTTDPYYLVCLSIVYSGNCPPPDTANLPLACQGLLFQIAVQYLHNESQSSFGKIGGSIAGTDR